MHIEDWNSTDCVAIFPRPGMRRLDIPGRQANRFREAFCQGLVPLHGLDTKQDDFLTEALNASNGKSLVETRLSGRLHIISQILVARA